MHFLQFLGVVASLTARSIAAPTATSNTTTSQTRITFDSSGTAIVGYHFYPTSQSSPAPVVILAHGLGGLQTSRIMPAAQRYASYGYHAITFDYRTWGQSDGQPRNILDKDQQLDDYRAAVTAVKSLPGVDPARIVLWGTSLSGGHVLVLGSETSGLSAIIAQCPHTNGPATVGALPADSLPNITATGLSDVAASAAGQPPVYIPLANKTGQFGALTQAGAYEGYQFVQPDPPAPGSVMAARFALELPFYSPDSLINITYPTFIGVGTTDNVTPPPPARTLAARINAELHEYDGGHFSVYSGASQFENIVQDQVAFLQKNVPI